MSRFAAVFLAAALLLGPLHPAIARADADDEPPPPRAASYEWDVEKTWLRVSLSYRDVVDASLRKKLKRGLPTTILFSATLYAPDGPRPLATTVQSCRVTWHVWEEAYRIDMTRPGAVTSAWTTTVDGVLRRCAEARRLVVAHKEQVSPGQQVYLEAKVQVNPVSRTLLERIKRWVSRPSATGTAAPGDALFGTFTGLFLQRIGDAERELRFTTEIKVPNVRQKQKRQAGS